MKRLTIKQKIKIKKLALMGYSLNRIKRELNLSKTTIYYHTKKVLGRKLIPIKINLSNNEKIGEFMGLFAGDGCYSYDKSNYGHKIRIFIGINEDEIKNYYSGTIYDVFGKYPRVYSRKSMYVIEIISKDVILFIKKYLKWKNRFKTRTIELVKNVKKYPIEFNKGFLRSLIDSDGYIRKGRNEIYFGSVSKNLIKNFIDSLKIFNFKFKIYKQKQTTDSKIFYEVRLSNEEVVKFCKTIKPIKGGHVGI